MGEHKKYNLTIRLEQPNTLVVFDTNAWLNLYNIPSLALEEIVEAIREKRDVFWIPNQVHREYQRNAPAKKKNIEKLFSNVRASSISEVEKSKDRVIQQLTTLRKQNQIMDDSLKNEIEEKFSELVKTIKEGYGVLEDEYEKDIRIIKEDNIVDVLVEEIYKCASDEDFSIIEKMRICEEGEIRYKYRIAPGFTDVDKMEGTDDCFRKYGDLIIWKEILKKVEDKSTNVIFVQDEKKQDWLAARGGTELAKVLLEEYEIATKGKGKIEVCNLEGFIDSYGEVLGLKAAEIKKLVTMLKQERSVYEYIVEKRSSIANSGIEGYFDRFDCLDSIYYDVGGCRSVYDGIFESATNITVFDIKLDACVVGYEKDMGKVTIQTRFRVQGNADVEENVGGGMSYVGNADFLVRGSLKQVISTIYDNSQSGYKRKYNIVYEDFDFEHLVFYNERDFDVKIQCDEY